MDKNKVVTISEWYKGMENHPIYGFGLLKNVEVFENKGLAKIKNRTVVVDTVDAVTALPIAEVYDIYGNTYTLTGSTAAGNCYKNGVLIQSSLPSAWDLAIYKDYLWIRHSTVMSCYGPLSSASAQWFGNVDTGFVDRYNGKLLVGQDDYLYSGNGNYVAKISVTSSGTVGVAPTLSSNKTALDLPDGQFVTTLEEYGTKIMVGTQGGNSYFERGNIPNARIYPWNRQLGTLGNPGLADLPIIFSENGINAIKQHANKLYVSAGTQGNIYVTDSTNYLKICTLPFTLSGINNQCRVFSNAISISPQGNLLVGVSADLNLTSKAGIYEIDTSSQGYPVQYRMPTAVAQGTLSIGFINSLNYQSLKIGWANNSSYGIDNTDYVMYPSYGGVIESPLIKVGGYNSKYSFTHIEWSLAEPLVEGQRIRIQYRLNNKDHYSIINTWGFSGGTGVKEVGGVISFEDQANMLDAEYVQLKIELDQDTNTIYGSNINLISVKLW